ncbi:uncharacterized protein BKA78DRAFT_12546 [Phyllosticta capitalensis]|uniref:uncharacterized protein n=1 Tax=Phyllosticta capitalensis TaxID=121624 RepID=UPI00312DAB1D
MVGHGGLLEKGAPWRAGLAMPVSGPTPCHRGHIGRRYTSVEVEDARPRIAKKKMNSYSAYAQKQQKLLPYLRNLSNHTYPPESRLLPDFDRQPAPSLEYPGMGPGVSGRGSSTTPQTIAREPNDVAAGPKEASVGVAETSRAGRLTSWASVILVVIGRTTSRPTTTKRAAFGKRRASCGGLAWRGLGGQLEQRVSPE